MSLSLGLSLGLSLSLAEEEELEELEELEEAAERRLMRAVLANAKEAKGEALGLWLDALKVLIETGAVVFLLLR